MPEALRAVIEYLIEEVGLSRVAATHDRNNAKSGRVMEKAGMKYEGTLRAAVRNNQGIGDKVCYAILKDDLSKSIKQRYHSSMSDEIILCGRFCTCKRAGLRICRWCIFIKNR